MRSRRLHPFLHLPRDLRGVRLAGTQHHAKAGVQVLDGPDEVHDPLLARDAAHEQHERRGRVDAIALQHVGGGVRLPELGVDPVVDDVDSLLSDVEQAQHIGFGAPG